MTKTKTEGKGKASRKPSSRKSEDKVQYDRFRKFASEVGTNNASETFDRNFRTIVVPKRSPK
jgi:hypothetical protein